MIRVREREEGERDREDDPFMVFTSVNISITHSHFLLPAKFSVTHRLCVRVSFISTERGHKFSGRFKKGKSD